jgi:two-component system response regulator (stage 0 sporulation protein F)
VQKKKPMKKILLIDNEENIQIVYREEFEDDGYQVVSALNGKEGLKKFSEEKPDIVILDIHMPGMGGVEVLRKMKTLDSAVPVVLSSAYQEFKSDLGTWASDAYILKSGDIGDLKRTVRELLEETRAE